MKMVVSYLNFVFFIEVKAKSKYRILNFVLQFIKKKSKLHFGYTDYGSIQNTIISRDAIENSLTSKLLLCISQDFKRLA